MTTCRWWVTSACWALLCWTCLLLRGPNQRGARLRACRWHTGWRGQGRSIHLQLIHSAWSKEMTWPPGKTLRKSDSWDRTRLYGLCKTGRWGALTCRGGHFPDGIVVFGHVEQNCTCESFFAEIPGYSFNKWRVSGKDVQCLGLNPNCSSRISPHFLKTCKIIASRIISNNLPILSKRLMGR